MSLSKFMSDFLIAGADYNRLNESVHRFLDSDDPDELGHYVHEISELIAVSKRSSASAVASGNEAMGCPIPNERTRSDVEEAYRLAFYWMDRIDTLASMMRFIALDSDADFIDLLARARKGVDAMDSARDHGCGCCGYDDEEESEEDESEDTVPDIFDGEDDGYDVLDFDTDSEDDLSEEQTESMDGEESDTEPVDSTGIVEHDITETESAEEPTEEQEDDGSEVFVVKESKTKPEEPVPNAQPYLSPDDVRMIVLETVTGLFNDTAEEVNKAVSEEVQEEPKKTTRRTRKTAEAKKEPRRGIRRAKKKEPQEGEE